MLKWTLSLKTLKDQIFEKVLPFCMFEVVFIWNCGTKCIKQPIKIYVDYQWKNRNNPLRPMGSLMVYKKSGLIIFDASFMLLEWDHVSMFKTERTAFKLWCLSSKFGPFTTLPVDRDGVVVSSSGSHRNSSPCNFHWYAQDVVRLSYNAQTSN